jgi:hypothetical protein
MHQSCIKKYGNASSMHILMHLCFLPPLMLLVLLLTLTLSTPRVSS